MPGINGQKRVVITNISPQVEDGNFPAKTILGKKLILSASIFSDGHEELGASIQIKHETERGWTELPLQLIHNDHWQTTFIPEKYGPYTFRVAGWIDHFAGWRKGFLKKQEA